MKLKQKFYSLALVSLILGALPDAGMRPVSAQTASPEVVRLADQPGAEVDYAAVWVAEELGYFKDENIAIDRRTYANGPAGLLDFANQSVDAEMAAIVPFMQFAARGGQFKIVISLTKGNAPLVGPKQYTSYKDLDGKRIGTPGIGTIHDAVVNYVEQSQGLKFQHVFGKVTDIAVMIEKGEVDAFVGWEPASAMAIMQNPKLHYIAQLPPIPNTESLSLIFQPGIAKNNPALIDRFVRATLRAMTFIRNSSKEKVAEIIAKKMNDPKAVPVVLAALGSVDIVSPRLDMPSTKILLQTIAKQGKIPSQFGSDPEAWVGKYLDYSFLDRAEASLTK